MSKFLETGGTYGQAAPEEVMYPHDWLSKEDDPHQQDARYQIRCA